MEKHQPYGSLFMYSFLKHVYLRENRPCHACAQGPREQTDVTGKANANFVGKFSKAVAYAIRFLGGAQREILADERSLRLLRAAMLGVSGLFMYYW